MIEFQVSEPLNGNGVRRIVAVLGERDYVDTFDPYSAFHREKFLQRAGQRLGYAIMPSEIPVFDAEITRRALEQDASHLAQPVQFERLTCADLDAGQFEQEYLIDRTLVAGQPAIIAGPKKALKTSIVVDMALSLVTGGFFLGKLKVARAANVALMSGESGMATLQETARRIARAAGRRLAELDGLVWSTTIPKLGRPDHLDALGRFIDGDEIEVLIIDPTYLAMPGGDAGNLFIQGELLRNVTEVCQVRGVTLILVHHTRKNIVNPFAPPELEDIAWSGFQEFARQWLLIGRRDKYEAGSGEHRLWLNVGGSAGHSALWGVDVYEGTYDGVTPRTWQVEVKRAEDVRQDAEERIEDAKQQKHSAKLEQDKKAVLKAFARFSNGETPNIVKSYAGMSGTRFNAVLAGLLEDGALVPCDVIKGNRTTPYDGYKLAEDE